MKRALILIALVTAAFAQPALAQKDDKPGRGGGQGQGQSDNARGNGPAAAPGTIVIADRDRAAVYAYYRNDFRGGNCPPGLAKKNNGCLPPGQAKKLWVIGQPLPASIAFYPLPGSLLVQLTPPPAGYQYARVANDILMMAIGTRMIVGAIADLSAM